MARLVTGWRHPLDVASLSLVLTKSCAVQEHLSWFPSIVANAYATYPVLMHAQRSRDAWHRAGWQWVRLRGRENPDILCRILSAPGVHELEGFPNPLGGEQVTSYGIERRTLMST